MRIISMQPGDGIKDIFKRFATACNECEKVLKAEGYGFMHNDHLGYILTCPSNLGTGLRAGAMVKLPLLSSRKDFKNLMKSMGLQARGTAGVDSASTGGTWDISNLAPRHARAQSNAPPRATEELSRVREEVFGGGTTGSGPGDEADLPRVPRRHREKNFGVLEPRRRRLGGVRRR